MLGLVITSSCVLIQIDRVITILPRPMVGISSTSLNTLLGSMAKVFTVKQEGRTLSVRPSV
jgi:hypothetical protein